MPEPTTWILLRGLTRESRHWGEFAAAFERGVPGARVATLDLPGNGRLNREASPASVPAMAAWCQAEMARSGISPPYHVLAMSLGAMVAVAWAYARPDLVTRCVLINTSLRPISPFYKRLRPANYAALLALLGRGAGTREGTILRLTSARHADDAALFERWAAIGREHPVSLRNALRQLRAAARYRAPRIRPLVPVLLLASVADRLVDVDCSRALAAAWGCELRLHDTAGHDLPLDDGEWVVGQVCAWLGG